MSEWKECKLGDIVTVKHGWPFKSEFFVDSIANKPIVVGIGNFNYLGGFRFSSTKLKYYTGDYPEEYELTPGDILLVMTCQTEGGEILGIPGIIPEDGKTYLHNQRLGKVIVTAPNLACNKFLYWLFLTSDFNQHLVNSASGTKILHTAPSRIEEFIFLIPPLSEQHAIASVLSSLDDKIALLHRQNKTIETMAETLFRQWFVEEADEGWEQKSLSSIANFLNGLACQNYPPKNETDKIPVLKIKELSSGISKTSDWTTSMVDSKYVVEAGDVIFSWSASLMVKIWDGESCVLNQHLFKVTSERFPKWFYLEWCKHHLDEFISISLSHATTMGHIKRSDLDGAMVIVPSDNQLSEMSHQMAPLLDKQIENSKQIRTLEKLRDTLLPKIMSGEVRIAF